MCKFIVILLIFVCFSTLLANFSLAQEINGVQKIDKYFTTFQYKNEEELKILNNEMNKISTQEMIKLGNYSEPKVYQNRYNQSILSIQKQAKFLNLFQFKRRYEYSVVNGIISYQNKWYDFMFKEI